MDTRRNDARIVDRTISVRIRSSHDADEPVEKTRCVGFRVIVVLLSAIAPEIARVVFPYRQG